MCVLLQKQAVTQTPSPAQNIYYITGALYVMSTLLQNR